MPASQWRAQIELPIERTTPAIARQVVGKLLTAWGLERFEEDLTLITTAATTVRNLGVIPHANLARGLYISP